MRGEGEGCNKCVVKCANLINSNGVGGMVDKVGGIAQQGGGITKKGYLIGKLFVIKRL